jgi:hypothetical protein
MVYSYTFMGNKTSNADLKKIEEIHLLILIEQQEYGL